MASNIIQTPEVRETTVFADAPKTLLARKTRYDYLMGYLPLYKTAIKARWYSRILAAIGLYALFFTPFPVLCLPLFFGAAYFKLVKDWTLSRVASTRKVIWGH